MVNEPEYPIFTFEACDLAIRQRTRLLRLCSQDYYEQMKKEAASIEPFLRGKKSVLDIGAGLGGVHIFTHRNALDGLELHILDRDALDPQMKFGYRPVTEAYNSFAECRNYLATGGFPIERLRLWNADLPDDLVSLATQRFDVVMSLHSWCFHYPVSTYLPLVSEVLKLGGTLIVDVRLNTDQEQILAESFASSTLIVADHQRRRLALRRS
jgi:SAM-dependent methyltransferase